MDIAVTVPTYGFTNQFPILTVTGGRAGDKLSVSLSLDNQSLLSNEMYFFDSSGQARIRFLGDLFEKYFYDDLYDITKFSQAAVLTLSSAGTTLRKEFTVFFCRSYLSSETLSPDTFRTMPLSRCNHKYTVSGAKEYLSFITTNGRQILCDIAYSTYQGEFKTRTVTLYTFTGSDRYHTLDVSYGLMGAYLGAGEYPIYWDVYHNGYKPAAIRYEVLKSPSFETTTFLFQNCFGGLESFLCRGIRKDEFTAERETGIREGRYWVTRQDYKRSFTVNTGPLDQDQKESVIELLSSRSLMVLTGGVALPVFITGENISLANTRNKLADGEITYSYVDRNLGFYRYNNKSGIFDHTFDNTFN